VKSLSRLKLFYTKGKNVFIDDDGDDNNTKWEKTEIQNEIEIPVA
jgi:hypothetical protein